MIDYRLIMCAYLGRIAVPFSFTYTLNMPINYIKIFIFYLLFGT